MILSSQVFVVFALVLLVAGSVLGGGFLSAAIGCAAVAALLRLVEYVRRSGGGRRRQAAASSSNLDHRSDDEDDAGRAPWIDPVDPVDPVDSDPAGRSDGTDGRHDAAAADLAPVSDAAPGRGFGGRFPQETAPGPAAAEQQSGSVFVIPGQPYFHAQRCPAVGHESAGEPDSVGDIEEVDVAKAQARGFAPCQVCRPLTSGRAVRRRG